MTDYGPQINPIIKAWDDNPNARGEFARILADRHQDRMDEIMNPIFSHLTAREIERRTEAPHQAP